MIWYNYGVSEVRILFLGKKTHNICSYPIISLLLKLNYGSKNKYSNKKLLCDFTKYTFLIAIYAYILAAVSAIK